MFCPMRRSSLYFDSLRLVIASSCERELRIASSSAPVRGRQAMPRKRKAAPRIAKHLRAERPANGGYLGGNRRSVKRLDGGEFGDAETVQRRRQCGRHTRGG